MKRLTHVLPLSVIAVLLFVSVAVAQSTPEQADSNPDGADPNAMDPAAVDPNAPDPSTLDPNSADPTTADPNAVDPSTLTTADPNASDQPVNNVLNFRLVTVDIEPWGFYRPDTPVEPGTTVRWINMDNRNQTVTADDGSFDSGVLKPGEYFDLRFDELGKWTYHSEKEPEKTGSITVRELTSSPAAAEPTQPAADNAASQPTVDDGIAPQPAADDAATTQPTDGTTAPPAEDTAAT